MRRADRPTTKNIMSGDDSYIYSVKKELAKKYGSKQYKKEKFYD